MARGQYLGPSRGRRAEGAVLLTLCDYAPNQVFSEQVHEHPGFFLLVKGDHREDRRQNSVVQPEFSVIYHGTGEAHATETGPSGMRGLNISLHSSWVDRLDLPRRPTSEAVELVSGNRPTALKLLAAVRGDDLSLDLVELATELFEPFVTDLEAKPPRWLARAKKRLEEDFASPIGLADLAES
ncbi:MAG: hypothetical protein ABUL49_01100, partial [bacterium]